MDRPVALLLAGGKARRMGGGDKALRLLHGRPMLEHVIARIRPQVADLVLNANGDPGRFAAWKLPVIADAMVDCGPLAGVLAGLRWTRTHHPDITTMLSVPIDTPFLPPDLVARLQQVRAAASQPIACAASGGHRHGVVALWSVDLADTLEAALYAGIRAVGAWAASQGLAIAAFEEGIDPFYNINDAEDLARADRLPPQA